MLKKIYKFVIDKASKFNSFCIENDEFVHIVVTPLFMVVIGFGLLLASEFTAGTVWIVGYFIYSRINTLARKGY